MEGESRPHEVMVNIIKREKFKSRMIDKKFCTYELKYKELLDHCKTVFEFLDHGEHPSLQ